MNYEGEKFLLKLYKDLDKSESLTKIDKRNKKNSANKYELLRKYLERLEKQEKVFDGEHEELEKFLKNRYFEKYVIKEEDIPESYWENQNKASIERGEGPLEYTTNPKHQKALEIIETQKDSLEKWLIYLMKENTAYPVWTRYWAFQGMLKLGAYDKEKQTFTKRTKKTTAPFIEINAEALSYTIETVQKYYEGTDITDSELKKLIESGNFGKIYSYNIWKLREEEKKNIKDKIDTKEGIWKTFKKGEEKEVTKLLEGKGTNWCIVGEKTAKDYLEKGNMYIYFTKNSKGEYVMPRVCIRQEYEKIKEVRGIEIGQNLEAEMNDITEKKLDEFEDKEEYKKKVEDMKKLTKIYNKSKNNRSLTKEELFFLYEVDDEIKGLGWFPDPRIKQLRRKNIIKDKNTFLTISKNKPNFLKYANESIRSDREIVLKEVKKNGRALKYASENLKNDRALVLEAVKQDGSAFGYASERLHSDREIALEALKQKGTLSEYISDELTNDKEFMQEAKKLIKEYKKR